MPAQDVLDRARQLQQSGVAATAAGRPDTASRRLRQGLRLLGWSPGTAGGALPTRHRALAARLLISLAYAESEQGHTRPGFALLDTAAELVDPADEGILVQQRALMLLRTGDGEQALRYFGAAVPLLTGSPHTVVLARTLLNRSGLLAAGGRVRAATEDLRACRELAATNGLRLIEAKALHNLGLIDVQSGDVAGALGQLARAEAIYRTEAPGVLPVVAAARARALLAVGLAGQAAESLTEAVAAFAEQRLSQDEAEAQLLLARAALGVGDAAGAAHWADRAAAGFRRRHNTAWSALAGLLRLRADFLVRPDSALANRAVRLARQLGVLGLADDARLAQLLAARVRIRGGQLAAAQTLVEQAGRARSFWLETLLLRRLTRAELVLAQAQPTPARARSRALGEASAGLAALHDRRARLGSLDLRVSTAALGRELATFGLRTALAGGTPRTVLDWSERSRAQAFRVLPVRPPDDPETAEALARLRQLRHQLRTAELAGVRDPATAAQCAELERDLREREWQVAGTGASVDSGAGRLAGLGPALGDRALVSYLLQDNALGAVVVVGGRTRLVPLGAADGLAEVVRRLLADLDALAGRTLPERLAAVVQASLRRQLEVLGDRLFRPLAGLLGERELVLVPAAELAALPWAMLPILRGRPVSVAPSAAVWLNAARSASAAASAWASPVSTVDSPHHPDSGRRDGGQRDGGQRDGGRRDSQRSGDGRVLLAAGPALEHVDREFDEIAAVRPGCLDLRGGRATVAATLAALDGAELAHLAGHGHHEPENVLFSRLDLADGPLLAYDVQRLAAVPRLITLSACDVGRSVVRPGDEQLGFTAALLYAGTACVVSSVCRVSHESAAAVMTALHRGLVDGAGPARALAAAGEKEALPTFVAFGAG